MEIKYKCHGPCGRELPESSFHKSSRNKEKRPVQYFCKECQSVDLRLRRYRKILEKSCGKILANKPVADTARQFSSSFKYLIETQFKLFYSSKIKTARGRLKLNGIIQDALFEFSEMNKRVRDRVKRLEEAEIRQIDYSNGNHHFKATQILGVSEEADEKTIKEAYLEKAKQAHPDHGGSLEEMKKINSAFDLLSKGNNKHG